MVIRQETWTGFSSAINEIVVAFWCEHGLTPAKWLEHNVCCLLQIKKRPGTRNRHYLPGTRDQGPKSRNSNRSRDQDQGSETRGPWSSSCHEKTVSVFLLWLFEEECNSLWGEVKLRSDSERLHGCSNLFHFTQKINQKTESRFVFPPIHFKHNQLQNEFLAVTSALSWTSTCHRSSLKNMLASSHSFNHRPD